MQMRTLGTAEISVVGFGAWEAGGAVWGEGPGDEGSIEAIRAALEAGISWIDTAEVYGEGRSEEVVGRAIADLDPKPFVATKVAASVSGYTPEGVRRGAEGSLRRLGLDVIDLFQIHWPDESTAPLETTWEAMAKLVDDGLARHIGVSNFNRERLERCERIRHVDSLQNHFSMLHRGSGPELFPWCERNGTAVLAYGPLAYGLLTGTIGMDTEFDDDDWRSTGGMSYYDELFEPSARARHLETIDAMRPIAEDLGITLSQLALAWVVAQPGVTSAIAGSRNPEHVRTNAAAGDVVIDTAKLDLLDEILEG